MCPEPGLYVSRMLSSTANHHRLWHHCGNMAERHSRPPASFRCHVELLQTARVCSSAPTGTCLMTAGWLLLQGTKIFAPWARCLGNKGSERGVNSVCRHMFLFGPTSQIAHEIIQLSPSSNPPMRIPSQADMTDRQHSNWFLDCASVSLQACHSASPILLIILF